MTNISRSKGNQTMEFSQLIECNMRNIFLEKPYEKDGEETIPSLFSEKLKLSISLVYCLKSDHNTGCFSRHSPLLGATKSVPKKPKNNFFPI